MTETIENSHVDDQGRTWDGLHLTRRRGRLNNLLGGIFGNGGYCDLTVTAGAGNQGYLPEGMRFERAEGENRSDRGGLLGFDDSVNHEIVSMSFVTTEGKRSAMHLRCVDQELTVAELEKLFGSIFRVVDGR
jgi:hypothetical protein